MVPVRLPAAMVEAIDELAGPGRRSEFIRAAIEREIARPDTPRAVKKRP